VRPPGSFNGPEGMCSLFSFNRISGFCWRCKTGVPGEGVNSSCNLGSAASATLPLMGSNISFCPAAAFRGFLPFDGSMFLGSLRPLRRWYDQTKASVSVWQSSRAKDSGLTCGSAAKATQGMRPARASRGDVDGFRPDSNPSLEESRLQ
jgi:hypothetical protein